MTTRHIAYIEVDVESFHRGGSTRTAVCLCGWKGPQRATLELVVDDAFEHEREFELGSVEVDPVMWDHDKVSDIESDK